MATLFSLLDDDGDRATLNEFGRSELILRAPRGARMDYTAAVELRDALTAWIGGALIPTPTAPEDIRTLIRKEISRSLGILAREARGEDGYETGELESAGLRAVATAAERATDALETTYHHPRCWAWQGKPCHDSCDQDTDPFSEDA